MTWTFRDTQKREDGERELAQANIAKNTYDGVFIGVGNLGIYDTILEKDEWVDGKKTGRKYKLPARVLKGKLQSEVTTLANGQATRYKGEIVGKTVTLGTVVDPKFDVDGNEVWPDDMYADRRDGKGAVFNDRVYRLLHDFEAWDNDLRCMMPMDFILKRTISYASNVYKQLKTMCGEAGIPENLDDELTGLIGMPTRFDVDIYVVPDVDERTGRENRNAGASYSYIADYAPYREGGDAEIIVPQKASKNAAPLPASKRTTLPTSTPSAAPQPATVAPSAPARPASTVAKAARNANRAGIAVLDRPAAFDDTLEYDDIPF